MLTNRNKRKRKYFIAFLASFIILLFIYIAIQTNSSDTIPPSIESISETPGNTQDTIEPVEQTTGKIQISQPFYN